VTTEFDELRQTADRLDEAVASLYGLNRTDLRCLGILYRRGRVSAGELAAESGLTPGAITTALDRLEKGGYANRVADPADRRRVLVLSTVAAREVGARLFGEVEVATHRLLDPRTPDELAAIRDFLRGSREVYQDQVSHITTSQAGQDTGEAADSPSPPEASAPISGSESARLWYRKGAGRVELRGGPDLVELYRASFTGGSPQVSVQGNTVTMESKRRFRPFDWSSQASMVVLNTGIPWSLSFKGGMFKLDADLRELRLESFEVNGGASDVEIWLPAPVGNIPIRISGGASRVRLHRPDGAALRADMSGGANQLVFDGQRHDAVGARNYFESPGFHEAPDRYDVRFSGGASQIIIDTE
jgi:DNA-binding MarR family transcriptional regulator